MKISLLAFGIAKEIFNSGKLDFEIPSETPTVDMLRNQLEATFPEIKKLSSYMIAIDNEYASGNDQIRENNEIAIIPPVSGG
jgi:molybdopterin synthase sulfur carrier subunit